MDGNNNINSNIDKDNNSMKDWKHFKKKYRQNKFNKKRMFHVYILLPFLLNLKIKIFALDQSAKLVNHLSLV